MTIPTLLLVDSYASSRHALASLLQECGYSVLEVHNPVEGLRVARERLPALVLLDLWPYVSASLQMVERLGKSIGSEPIPVLVLTSSPSPQHRKRARVAGCAGYLEKPCPPERVLAELERLLTPPLSLQATGSTANHVVG